MTRRTTNATQPATARRRATAFMVDCVGVSVLLAIVSVLIGGAGGSSPEELIEPLSRWQAALTSTVGALYFVVSWPILGNTPGQRVLGVRVLSDPSGSKVSFPRALARWALLGGPLWIGGVLLPGLSGLVVMTGSLMWAGVLLVSTARSPDRRGFHDRVAGTGVVRAAASDLG